MNSVSKPFAGWGNYPLEGCRAFRPEKASAQKEIVASENSLLARGLGRAYGDAALNSGGVVLQEKLGRFLEFDPNSGVLFCEGGATFADILQTFVPRGFFLPVTPGTKFVTVGGAIACDVHGKNHHRDGNISNFVESFDLLVASGEIVHCSREENADVFRATIGGMGLTGIIVRAKLRLLPVVSAFISVDYQRAPNLDAALEKFSDDDDYQYSVAWIDCLASGNSLGRSVLIRGNHAVADELDEAERYAPLRPPSKKKKSVPFPFPDFALNPLSVKAFNAAYYAAHPDGHAIVDYDSFFYPLDGINNWNRIYGKRGFIQYQVVFPLETSRAGLIQLLEKVAASGRASFLAVLKTFGPANDSPLSFPFAGHTLALDIPFSEDLPAFARELDEIVLKHNGRVYLAKDATLAPDHFRAMYPRLAQFEEIKARVDPDNKFQSSLSKRLRIGETKSEGAQ